MTPAISPVTLDMSQAQPIATAPRPPVRAPVSIDMSKAQAISTPAPAAANDDTESKGPLHQVGGFLQGAGENIAGAVKGIHSLFQEPQNDDEKAVQQAWRVRRTTSAGGIPFLAWC